MVRYELTDVESKRQKKMVYSTMYTESQVYIFRGQELR